MSSENTDNTQTPNGAGGVPGSEQPGGGAGVSKSAVASAEIDDALRWENLDELRKEANKLNEKATQLPTRAEGADEDREYEQAADALLVMIQRLGESGAKFAKSARRLAEAAESEKENAKKAATNGKAVAAAHTARKYADAADKQAKLVEHVVLHTVQTARDAISGTRTTNALSAAKKATLDVRSVGLYGSRAIRAAEAAEKVAGILRAHDKQPQEDISKNSLSAP